MVTFEYTDTFDYSAAAVFAALTDLEARPTWIKGILEVRVTPAGPARLGTSYFEAGKFSGFKSEKTMSVTEYEQARLLTLATPAEASNPFRESYRIEPLSEETCRVHFTVDVGNVPKVAEFFMRQEMKKAQPQNAARLKSILASRAQKAS
jgi:ribosome-associated toxin RatA of RatAB toxin-antitoxin module